MRRGQTEEVADGGGEDRGSTWEAGNDICSDAVNTHDHDDSEAKEQKDTHLLGGNCLFRLLARLTGSYLGRAFPGADVEAREEADSRSWMGV